MNINWKQLHFVTPYDSEICYMDIYIQSYRAKMRANKNKLNTRCYSF